MTWLDRRSQQLGYKDYEDYLRGEHWKALKRRFAANAQSPKACIGCGARKYQLHHRSYARLGAEMLTDLVPLCGLCHRKVHEHLRIHGGRLEQKFKAIRNICSQSQEPARKKVRTSAKPKKVATRPDWWHATIPIICLATPAIGEPKGFKKPPRNGWKTYEEAMGE